MRGIYSKRLVGLLLLGAFLIVPSFGTVFAQSTTPPASGGTTLPTDDGGGANCDTTFSSPLSWIICPINDGLANTANFVYGSLVVPQLETNILQLNKSASGTNATDGIITAWESFRNIANVLLVIFLLVAVIGQAVGGVLDSYSIKKIIPRVLIAAILLNLSLYLMVALEDIFNLLGNGIRDLLLAPFRGTQSLQISPGGWATNLFAGGITVVGGSIVATVGAGVAASGAATIVYAALPFLLLSVLLPLILAVIGVFFTLVIRQGLILLLLLASPIAFALYVLPNTEKYFKQWWSLLIKTFMVFPIVAAFITMGEILGGLTSSLNNNLVGDIAGLLIRVLPLFLIPFAFKFAGGLVGSISGAVAGLSKRGVGMAKGNPNDPNSAQRRASNRMRTGITQARGDLYNKGLKTSSAGITKDGQGRTVGRAGSFVRSKGGLAVAKMLGGNNIEGKLSELREQESKRFGTEVGFGDDTERRASLTDKDLYQTSTGGIDALRASSYIEDEDFKVGDDGSIKLANPSGQFYNRADVKAGYGRFDGDEAAQQKNVAHEINKALLGENHDKLMAHLPQIQQNLGMDNGKFNGLLKGAGYETKGKSIVYKHTSVQNDPVTGVKQVAINGSGMVDEAHTLGAYALTGQDADMTTTLTATYLEAMPKALQGDQKAQVVIEKLGDLARGYQGMTPGAIQAQIQAQGPETTPGASAAVNLAIQEFAATVGSGTKQANMGVDRQRASRPNQVIKI